MTPFLILGLSFAGQSANVKLPDTPTAKLAIELVDAINSGDKSRIQNFVDQHLEDSDKAADVAFAIRTYQEGGIQILGVNRPANPLILNIKSKTSDHFAKLLTGEGKTANTLAGYNIMPSSSATDVSLDDMPSTRQPDSDLPGILDERARRLADAGRLSGAILVAKDDKILYKKAYGLADRDFGIPNTVQTKFHMASCGKMFTSVAIAQLVQQGKLSFDDTLAKVLPDYPNKDAASKITVKMLLTHTSGLPDIFDNPKYDRRKKYASQSDYFDIFANDPLLFEPGKGSRYSNAGFIVLGAIIEKVSGEEYTQYIQRHVFDVAGMKDSGYFATDQVVKDRAIGYGTPDDDPYGIEPEQPNWLFIGWKGNGCGGCYSTVEDMLKFSIALRGYKLVNKQLTETIVSPQTALMGADHLNYGYGFMASLINGKLVTGHDGGGLGSGIATDFNILWNSGYTVVTLTNMDKPDATRFQGKILRYLGP